MKSIASLFTILLLALVLAACGSGNPTSIPAATPAISSSAATPTSTSFQPSVTSTSQPLAARVNGEGISLEEYQAELSRYQASVGTELATTDKQRVMDELVDQLLLAQAAAQSGYQADEATLDNRVDQLTNQLGGAVALETWMASHAYTKDSFRQDLARSIAAAWMRDQIIQKVPEAMEQVHARQILVYSQDTADEMLARLNAGKDFTALAAEVDPVSKGDLGWFPRGYLLDPKLEQAAFSLQPGEHSPIIQTGAGFHILQVIERDAQHPLEPDARLTLQSKALQDWLAEQRKQSKIEILSP
jgi:peptidyl-prolyl cis-trans isomerase C